MLRAHFFVATLAVLWIVPSIRCEEPALLTAQGKVEKADKDSLTIQPRGSDGRFGKSVVLKLTGTSKISTLTTQVRNRKTVLVQKDTDAKDLEANQVIAVIYTQMKEGAVLLTAVVQPQKEK
jgi:hypothetical protein